MYEHLVNNIPNNATTRWLIDVANARMRYCKSKYYLARRYRKPKEGHKYGYGGNLRCDNATRIALYLRYRPSCKKRKYNYDY